MKTEKGWKLKPYNCIEEKFTGWLQYHQVSVFKDDKKSGFDDKKNSKFQIDILESRTK